MQMREGKVLPSQANGTVPRSLFHPSGPHLQAAGPEVKRRVRQLADSVAAGHPASVLLQPCDGGPLWVAEAFPSGEIGSGDGTIVLRPLQPPPWSAEDLMALYGFTLREAQIALGMLYGLDVKTVASRLKLRVGTIRQYLKSAYCKTGTRNQAQLLTLLTGSQPNPLQNAHTSSEGETP
ncbi:MAG: hypothetical protein AAGD34_05125 [Pseudomonadota bacterium]